MNTVGCVIVTYNRKTLLLRNITALLDQSCACDIIIVDNASTDGTYEYIHDSNILFDNIKYIRLEKNIGGAGGFETGTRYAFEKKYDYVCLMDDDGYPLNTNTIAELVKSAEESRVKNPLLMLNSLVLCEDNMLSFGLGSEIKTKEEAVNKSEDGFIVDEINPFNGTLFSRELLEIIGFPNGDFFIKGDENDMQNRAKKAGAFIATVISSEYYHPSLPKLYKVIGGKEKLINIEAPWKEYYRSRNYSYMYAKDKKYKRIVGVAFYRIRDVFYSDQPKLKTAWMIIRGAIDGVRGKLGPTVKP